MTAATSRARQQGGQARTRLARRAVVGAAGELFVERGYAATTVEAISERSDIPGATVYRLFASKLGILKALLDVSVAGDDEAVPLAQRPEVRRLEAETDARAQLAGFARICRQINVRTGSLFRVLIGAAGTDPEAGALLAGQNRQRQQGQSQIVRMLARAGALRPGLKEREAADVIYALMSPEVFQLLVTERRWTADRYERWLAGVLAEQLLGTERPGS